MLGLLARRLTNPVRIQPIRTHTKRVWFEYYEIIFRFSLQFILVSQVPRAVAKDSWMDSRVAGAIFVIAPISTFCLGVWQYRFQNNPKKNNFFCWHTLSKAASMEIWPDSRARWESEESRTSATQVGAESWFSCSCHALMHGSKKLSSIWLSV